MSHSALDLIGFTIQSSNTPNKSYVRTWPTVSENAKKSQLPKNNLKTTHQQRLWLFSFNAAKQFVDTAEKQADSGTGEEMQEAEVSVCMWKWRMHQPVPLLHESAQRASAHKVFCNSPHSAAITAGRAAAVRLHDRLVQCASGRSGQIRLAAFPSAKLLARDFTT